MNPAQIENSNKSRRGKPNNSGREIPPPAQLVPKGILPIVAGAPRPKCVHAYISVARVAVLLYWAIAISVGRTRATGGD